MLPPSSLRLGLIQKLDIDKTLCPLEKPFPPDVDIPSLTEMANRQAHHRRNLLCKVICVLFLRHRALLFGSRVVFGNSVRLVVALLAICLVACDRLQVVSQYLHSVHCFQDLGVVLHAYHLLGAFQKINKKFQHHDEPALKLTLHGHLFRIQVARYSSVIVVESIIPDVMTVVASCDKSDRLGHIQEKCQDSFVFPDVVVENACLDHTVAPHGVESGDIPLIRHCDAQKLYERKVHFRRVANQLHDAIIGVV
jgi:hypothetical protein